MYAEFLKIRDLFSEFIVAFWTHWHSLAPIDKQDERDQSCFVNEETIHQNKKQNDTHTHTKNQGHKICSNSYDPEVLKLKLEPRILNALSIPPQWFYMQGKD